MRSDRVKDPRALPKEESRRQRDPATVLFVEASSGGVVGGSLTGLVQQISGLGPEWRPVMALYEPKAIEPELRQRGVSIHHVPRWRVPRTHPLQQTGAYRTARSVGAVRRSMHAARLAVRTVAEELPAALALARIIRTEHPAVVHLGNGVRANFDGVLACCMTRRPCVCHVKGFEKYGRRERWAARRVDAMVCMTAAIKSHCEKNGVRAPVMPVIYDALDVERFQPQRQRAALRAEFGLRPNACAAGIIGGIQEWKGQAVVVEAMALAREREASLHCLIVGGVHRAGKAYADGLQRRVAELGLHDAVTFLGFRPDVADVISALDIVVHASIRPEPFGRVILEGMLLGKPVVATAAGGVPEFVADRRTGLLVPPGDAPTLGDRLVELARDQALRRHLGSAARAYAREKFSLPAHVQAMTDLYGTLMARR